MEGAATAVSAAAVVGCADTAVTGCAGTAVGVALGAHPISMAITMNIEKTNIIFFIFILLLLQLDCYLIPELMTVFFFIRLSPDLHLLLLQVRLFILNFIRSRNFRS
jgi:hypothetical protein